MKNNYVIIGGQYERYNHGGAPTLTGAKRKAKKCAEYWDNWQGWHVPSIYKIEDCITVKNFYGEQLLPMPDAVPVAIYDNDKEQWTTPQDLY